ncbi:MAG TPA: AAA family ATPase [Rubricoccaceae bacterium]
MDRSQKRRGRDPAAVDGFDLSGIPNPFGKQGEFAPPPAETRAVERMRAGEPVPPAEPVLTAPRRRITAARAVAADAEAAPPDDFGDVMTARDLMAREFPAVRWAVPLVIPEGSTLLAAKPKTGKSRLMLNVAVALASGGCALGSIRVEQGRVLYIALEGSLRTLQEAVRRMLPNAAVPELLHIATEWPTGQAGADRIAAFVALHPDTRLVVIDTLKRVRAPGGKGVAMYDADYDGAAPFGDLPKRMPGVAVVAVHHASKREASAAEDPFDLVSGSTGLTGAFDTVAVLTRASVAGESGARLYVRGRDTEETAAALAWDDQLTTWVYRGDASTVEASAERQAVRAVLADAGPDGLALREVVDALRAEHPGVVKGDGSNVRHLVGKMARDHESGVRKLGRGRYSVSLAQSLHNVHSVHNPHTLHNAHNPSTWGGVGGDGAGVVNGAELPAHNGVAPGVPVRADSEQSVSDVNAVNGARELVLGSRVLTPIGAGVVTGPPDEGRVSVEVAGLTTSFALVEVYLTPDA